MKKIVCLWGGPGAGKSVTCSGLFNKLKKLDYNCEMNREYVKDWIWEERNINYGDQIYIAVKQMKKEISYILNKLDFIITDCPLALVAFYANIYDRYEKEFRVCDSIVKQHHQFCKDNGYETEHYFLIRTKAYNPSGRYQDEATALKYDSEIKTFLNEYKIKFKEIICDNDVEDHIIRDLI